MKKERKRRICNYFMKALLLCVLVFGFGFIAGVDVNAKEHYIYVDESGSIKPSSITVSKSSDSTHSFKIINNAAKPVKITLDNNVTPKSKNYRMRIKVGGHECVSRENAVPADANVLYLYPGQEMENACEVIFDSSTSATITMKSEYLDKEVKSKDKAIGLNQDTAIEIPLSGMQYSLYEGVTAHVGKDERWYKFNVSDRAVINPTFELAEKERNGHFGSNNTYIRMYNSRREMIYKEATAKSDLSSKVEQWNPGPITLTKDTYYVCISVDKSAYYPATFMFNLNGHNWIYANGVTCSPSEINLEDIGKKKVIAQTVPANSDDKIIEVYDHLTGKTWDWYNSNTVDYDGIPSKATTPGRHAWITFKTTNGKTFTTYVISPAEKLKKPRVATGYNSASSGIDYPNKRNTSVRIQVLKNGKWTTAKTIGYNSCGTSNPVTIKGLKPLTNYKFRLQSYANGMTGDPSDVVTMKTGSSKKPGREVNKSCKEEKSNGKRMVAKTLDRWTCFTL